jgi:hypothetical protein
MIAVIMLSGARDILGVVAFVDGLELAEYVDMGFAAQPGAAFVEVWSAGGQRDGFQGRFDAADLASMKDGLWL